MFTPEDYTFAATLFLRLLGFIYFWAFGAFLFQIKGLIGTNGILPLDRYLHWLRIKLPRRCYTLVPTIFWLNSSDRALMTVVASGTVLSVLLMCGVYPPIILILLYVLYLSIVSAGQDFLGFGWEGFLLEITVNAFFLSLSSPPNVMVWISLNLVLFRFHFQGGAVKLQSQDPNWRNLTGVAYHYESQPLPNMIAWYAHKLPMWFHKLSTLFMFIVEIGLPFAMFGTDGMRLAVFAGFISLQFFIWATGNFSYLNHMTVVLSTILVANVYMPEWLMFSASTGPASLPVSIICTAAGTFLTLLQLIQLWQHFYPNSLFHYWLQKFSSYFICNRYGIFAIMTTQRFEIIFEGSDDQKNWKEYYFFYKPSEVDRRPRRISPYQPRIDWQAWFLPLGGYRYDAWLTNFIYHLLQGTPEVLKLIRHNPFPDAPPKFVRSVMYEYTFSSFKEKKEHGWWWRREFIDLFTEPMTLRTK